MTAQGSASTALGSAPTLRPYQSGAITGVRRELNELDHRSTLVVAATGTGKTVTFAELARIMKQQGGRVLIVVHRDELIRQAVRKLEAVGLHADIEKGSQRANTLARIVVASVQTLKGKRLARWARDHFTFVIVDEAHHALAKSYRDIIDYFDAAKVVGFTATPHRADGKPLGDVFESVAFRYEIRQAIAEKYLVPIVARRIVIDSVDLSGIDSRAGDFAQDQLAEVMADEQALRGAAVPLLELARDRQTIGFCVDVAHARKMAETMNALRLGCARFVSGETDEDEREELLAAFNRREFQFLFNCDVLTEGFDAPVCSCVAMLRPTKSWARFVQCAGRGLRLLGDTLDESFANGKRDCLLLDVTGTAGKHKLIGPADCLVGAGDIPDDLREEIERLLGKAQLDLAEVIEHAENEVLKRRDALKISALVKYHAEHIDPFIGEDEGKRPLPPNTETWQDDPPSQAQLKALEDEGINLSKLPKMFSRAQAWKLLARLMHRGDLCSYKQAKRLHGYGIDTRTLKKTRATELIGKLIQAQWHPSALDHEPEVHAAREARRGVA
jgi:superfamily II DNA or RNA helicase